MKTTRPRSLLLTHQQARAAARGDLREVRMPMRPQPILVDGHCWEWPERTQARYDGHKHHRLMVRKGPALLSAASWGASVTGGLHHVLARFCPLGQPGAAVVGKHKDARHHFRLAAVSVGRVQSIDENGARASGAQILVCKHEDGTIRPLLNVSANPPAASFLESSRPWIEADLWRHAFAVEWDRAHKRGERWADNPWTWIYSLERTEV